MSGAPSSRVQDKSIDIEIIIRPMIFDFNIITS